jgi:hypothetical protein
LEISNLLFILVANYIIDVNAEIIVIINSPIMIKTLQIVFATILFINCNELKAQDTLKAPVNSWATELSFNPFDGTLSLNNANAQIKLRRFLSNNRALRLAFTVGYMQDNSKLKSTYGLNPVDANAQRHSFLFAVNVGEEKHFNGSRRLSPYIGWEIGTGIKSSNQVTRSGSNSVTVKGAWEEVNTYYNGQYYYTSTSYVERGFWSLDATMIAGFDFYMAKGFYLGYEFNFGLNYIRYSKIEITETTDLPNFNTNIPDQNDESWKFGPKVVNGIRVGYVF